MKDEVYMRRAIELAEKGEGYVNPNPMVGAVIVKGERIIGEGFHERYGELHAERNAIASLTESAEGATIYVTLEPCCHYGKTPPCTEAIINSGISRVVIGSRDPNPLVSGKGAGILRENGITVENDFMRKECDGLNPVFFKYISTGMPYVVLKYAMTADGKIATVTGESKWITGEEARKDVAGLRHRYMGIMAGIGTVLADNPMLNARGDNLKSPVRIICDSALRIPTESNICRTADKYRTIVAYGIENKGKRDELEAMGIETVFVPDDRGRVDVKRLIKFLGQNKIDSVLVEGGGELNDSILRNDLIDRAEVYVAPKIFGGKTAKSPVGGEGIGEIDKACRLRLCGVKQIGEDVRLSYERIKKEEQAF